MSSLRRLLILCIGVALTGCSPAAPASSATDAADVIRIGAVFPLGGNAAELAGYELRGVQIAAELVNADGGVAGRRLELEVRDLQSGADAPAVMASLRKRGAKVVIGAYGSDLSIAASQAASAAGLVYWEAGAVADRLTGRGLPLVFRVGASGGNLGSNSAAFAASQLAARLGRSAADLRLAIVAADDAYATSVSDAAAATATSLGMPIALRTTYSLAIPAWDRVMVDLAAARPDVIILASHIPDGIAFRQAMLASGLKVGALIGSTMAECDPDFAGELGADAIGIFASDRPTAGFQPDALTSEARVAYDRFAAALGAPQIEGGSPPKGGAYGGASEYAISGPGESASATATEEALSGFTAAWALFHDVLPAAAPGQELGADAVAAAARAVDLPEGSLPNGAGLRFSGDQATLGQNQRAAAVIWQWQAVRSYAFVWPATFATGSIRFVPLP